jgi:hypothetical protein
MTVSSELYGPTALRPRAPGARCSLPPENKKTATDGRLRVPSISGVAIPARRWTSCQILYKRHANRRFAKKLVESAGVTVIKSIQSETCLSAMQFGKLCAELLCDAQK